jgi:hypothetical protein
LSTVFNITTPERTTFQTTALRLLATTTALSRITVSEVSQGLFITVLRVVAASAAAAQDSTVLSLGKVVANAASVADSTTLRSQGFSAFDFFAEDYVGSSRTIS